MHGAICPAVFDGAMAVIWKDSISLLAHFFIEIVQVWGYGPAMRQPVLYTAVQSRHMCACQASLACLSWVPVFPSGVICFELPWAGYLACAVFACPSRRPHGPGHGQPSHCCDCGHRLSQFVSHQHRIKVHIVSDSNIQQRIQLKRCVWQH